MRPSSKRIVKELQPDSATQGRTCKQWHHRAQRDRLCFPPCVSHKWCLNWLLRQSHQEGGGLRSGSRELIRPSQLTWVGNKHALAGLQKEPLHPASHLPWAPLCYGAQWALGGGLPTPHLIPMGPQFLQKECIVCDKSKRFYQEGSLV